MTEAEWLACRDPKPMLKFIGGQASDRKLRLFAVSVAHQAWPCLVEPDLRNALDIAERGSDGAVPFEALHVATKRVDDLLGTRAASAGYSTPSEWFRTTSVENRSIHFWVFLTVFPKSMNSLRNADSIVYSLASKITGSLQPQLLREAFGNPFRSVLVDPAWLTSTVLGLATGIYEEKSFDRMPILADALQDAGCDSEEILNHCRQPGEHVRGCWVIDTLLGKS